MTVSLKGIVPVRIFEQAVYQLRVSIENGEFQVGEKLPSEKDLCAALNTSRTSVREALRVLETEGLVESRKGVGTFVAARSSQISSQNMIVKFIRQQSEALRQLLEVREYMEGLSARLAAESPSPELISELTQILDEMTQLENKKDNVSMEAAENFNLKYHLAISRASKNDIVHEVLLQILPYFSESNKMILYFQGSLSKQLEEHRQILEAIRSGNPDEAEMLVRAHIKRVRQEVIMMESEDEESAQ